LDEQGGIKYSKGNPTGKRRKSRGVEVGNNHDHHNSNPQSSGGTEPEAYTMSLGAVKQACYSRKKEMIIDVPAAKTAGLGGEYFEQLQKRSF